MALGKRNVRFACIKNKLEIQVFNEPYNMKLISYPNCFESDGGDEAFSTHFSSQKVL